MLHPSTQKLIDKLFEMTSEEKITWVEGDDGTCVYDTEGYRVTIGQTPSRLVLLDAGGRVLETVSDTLLANSLDEDGQSYAMKIDTMVSKARRSITGSVAIIDKIVTSLDLDGDGVPDVMIEETVETVSEPPPANLNESFPGQTEMTSKVAILAEQLVVQPEEEPSVEAEVTDLSAHSGMSIDTVEKGSSWAVPEEAGEVSDETVEDFSEPEVAVTETTDDSILDNEVVEEPNLAVVTEHGPETASGLVSSEAETASGLVSSEAETAEEPFESTSVEPAAEPAIFEAPSWGDASSLIDAQDVTPEVYTTAIVDGGESAEVTASEDVPPLPEIEEDVTSDMVSTEVTENLEAETTESVSESWSSGTPYITGLTNNLESSEEISEHETTEAEPLVEASIEADTETEELSATLSVEDETPAETVETSAVNTDEPEVTDETLDETVSSEAVTEDTTTVEEAVDETAFNPTPETTAPEDDTTDFTETPIPEEEVAPVLETAPEPEQLAVETNKVSVEETNTEEPIALEANDIVEASVFNAPTSETIETRVEVAEPSAEEDVETASEMILETAETPFSNDETSILETQVEAVATPTMETIIEEEAAAQTTATIEDVTDVGVASAANEVAGPDVIEGEALFSESQAELVEPVADEVTETADETSDTPEAPAFEAETAVTDTISAAAPSIEEEAPATETETTSATEQAEPEADETEAEETTPGKKTVYKYNPWM